MPGTHCTPNLTNGTDAAPEEWRDIAKFEGRYQVSSRGRVKSLPRQFINKGGQLQVVNGRILKNIVDGGGYAFVNLGRWLEDGRYKSKIYYVHRLVLGAFVGPCPPGLECRHLDGDQLNNVLGNLCWGTDKENMADRKAHGRTTTPNNKGERHGLAILTDERVREIRLMKKNGWSTRGIATAFGYRYQLVWGVLKGTCWTHVT